MNITLYSNTSADNVVDKTLTQLTTTTGNLLEETDVLNPSFLLTNIDDYVATCNYIYVSQLGRYYFVLGIDSVREGLWRLNCHVDVLETYATKIKQQAGIVARQEHNYNIKLSDNRLKVQASPYTQILNFPNGFGSSFTYVIIGAGEGGADEE